MPGILEYTVTRREALTEKVCPVCGRSFEGLSRRRYCSSSCLHKAYNQRHAEQRKAYQRERYRREKRQGGEGL